MPRLTLSFDSSKGKCKMVENKHLSLFWQAVKLGFALNEKYFKDANDRVLGFVANHTHEKILLNGLALLVRNGSGDLAKAAIMFESEQKALKKYDVQESYFSDGDEQHGFRLYVLTLYAKALCHYYGERDVSALRAFRRCLNVLERHDRRSVCGIVRIGDVRHKVDSLSFLLNEYKQARDLVRRGNFGAAVFLLDPIVAKLGADYLDHEVVLLAAEAHLANGDMCRGSALALTVYQNTPGCMEAQFVYALTLFAKGDDASLRRFVKLSKRFASMNTTCKFTLVKQSRMTYVLDDLRKCVHGSTAGVRRLVVGNANSEFVHLGLLKCRKCIQFVTLRK